MKTILNNTYDVLSIAFYQIVFQAVVINKKESLSRKYTLKGEKYDIGCLKRVTKTDKLILTKHFSENLFIFA